MTYRIVIPARYGSERLPGKPLLDLGGKPMVVRAAEAAARSGAAQTVVATDDERVLQAVRAAGFEAVLTRPDHPSGTDRLSEVARLEGWPDDEVVINLQGDEPLMPPAVLDQLAAALTGKPAVACATLCEPIRSMDELNNPNLVKVVRDAGDLALYFSRAPVPWDRDTFGVSAPELPSGPNWWRHIGVYAYWVRTLHRFVELPPGRLEAVERLEQLRLLEQGMSILVEAACEEVPGGVDTPEDLARIRDLFQ
jgi:3-deoxy-manno-octulosonate cytidylyltransferase (CMP-KDO synthetase)